MFSFFIYFLTKRNIIHKHIICQIFFIITDIDKSQPNIDIEDNIRVVCPECNKLCLTDDYYDNVENKFRLFSDYVEEKYHFIETCCGEYFLNLTYYYCEINRNEIYKYKVDNITLSENIKFNDNDEFFKVPLLKIKKIVPHMIYQNFISDKELNNDDIIKFISESEDEYDDMSKFDKSKYPFINEIDEDEFDCDNNKNKALNLGLF